MITILPESISTVEEAKNLLKALNDNGEAFHCEDDANDLSGDPFTKEEGDKLNALMEQIYSLGKGFDPCKYLNTIRECFEMRETYGLRRYDNYMMGGMRDAIEWYDDISWENDCHNKLGEAPYEMVEYVFDLEINSGFILKFSKPSRTHYAFIGKHRFVGSYKNCEAFILKNAQ